MSDGLEVDGARSQDDYRSPIILALGELGGKAPRQEVLRYLEENLVLSPEDKEELDSDGSPRWTKHADYMVFKMRGEEIKDSSEVEKGTWALTDAGWEEYERLS